MKIREVKELTTAEIQERLAAERDNLVRLKVNHAVSPLENTGLIKETRRTIARFLTELRLREMNNEQ